MPLFDSSRQSEPLHPDSVLAGLDPDQRAAVTAPVGIVVVRAGAGSGKTTVLTRRIAWRALSGTAEIERTLAITFTRQAATEMRSRLARFDLDGRPTIGTFHAIARKLMLQFLEDNNRRIPVIVNNRASLMMACMGDDAKSGTVYNMLTAVDWAHSHMITPAKAAASLSAAKQKIPMGAQRFTEVFEEYERTKKKRGVLDLNDFMTSVIVESKKDPRFQESIRFQYRHISVDEAQDMNPLQYAFLKVLAPPTPDLFLVGDPNQAIFGFNGADRNLFDQLPDFVAGVNVIPLPNNYRCTPEIVQIAVDTLAKDGQVATAISQRSSGRVVQLERCTDDAAELRFIVKAVRRAESPQRTWNDIAVLTRINSLAESIRKELVRSGIPVRSSRSGGAWARAIGAASALTGRDELTAWAADVLDTGEYSKDDADYQIAVYVRQFLDENRSGSVNGRTFGSWMATSADVADLDGVEVLTFHAAKGREWSCVIVAGLEKGLMPHSSARASEARSEEARLAYVALTRAANDLTVTWTDTRGKKQTGPSPFLPSVTTAIPQYSAPPDELREIARTHSSKLTSDDALKKAINDWCVKRARVARINPDGVLADRQIRSIVRAKPATTQELVPLTDVLFVQRFGEELLSVIAESLAI